MSTDDLLTELNTLGVNFLTTNKRGDCAQMTPVALLVGLALDPDARVQSVIIVLLLVRPDYASHAPQAASLLPPAPRLLFMSYCAAATLLQKKYASQLNDLLGEQIPLPDLFFDELYLSTISELTVSLCELSDQQRKLSGEKLNWLGTYEQAAQRLITRLERERLWAM